MSQHHRSRHPAARLASIAAGSVALVALFAGSAVAQTSTTGPGNDFQFASGEVTSVHGTAVQVSNSQTNSESTVDLQDSTTYTKTVSTDASDITVGACVRATGSGSTSKGITARSISLSTATSDGCGGPRGAPGPVYFVIRSIV